RGRTLARGVGGGNPRARPPRRLHLQGDAPVRREVRVAEEAPPEVGAQVATDEAEHAQPAPLVDVDLLVAEQPGRWRGRPDDDQRPEGDARASGRHRTPAPEPVVTAALDAPQPPDPHPLLPRSGCW